jgi:putative transposase
VVSKLAGMGGLTKMRPEDLPLQALNHAVWPANSDLSELIHHSDHRLNPLSTYLRSTDRLAELGHPSFGRATRRQL